MVARRLAALGLVFGAIPPAEAATVQVMVGVDVAIRTDRTKRPVSVGAFVDAEVLAWTWRPSPLGGVVVRYRAGRPERRSLLLAGRAGMGVVTCCDGGATTTSSPWASKEVLGCATRWRSRRGGCSRPGARGVRGPPPTPRHTGHGVRM